MHQSFLSQLIPKVVQKQFAWVLLVSGLVGPGSYGDEEFQPRVVIRRAFPAIKNVEAASRQAAEKVLQDDELVIGVEVNGQSRAYGINMLTGPAREIINDQLGGKSIAATW